MDFNIRRVSFVTDIDYLEEIVSEAVEEKAVITFTLVLPDFRKKLLELSAANGLLAVDLLGSLIDAIAAASGKEPLLEPGLSRRMDQDYFNRIEAIDFAVKYDNGNDTRGFSHADLVLIGVSRTSKTPVSMYLARKRLRVANLALVPEVPLPEELLSIPKERIIGLTIEAEKLYQIRQERLKSMGLTANADYASMQRIHQELAHAGKVMEGLGCPVINVTNKAVEETAREIVQIYNRGERYGK